MPVEFRPDSESIVRLTEGRLSNHPDTYGYYWLDGRRIEHTSILEFRDDDGTWFPVMAMHVRYVYGCLLGVQNLTDDFFTVYKIIDVTTALRLPTPLLSFLYRKGAAFPMRDGGTFSCFSVC